MDFKAEEWFPSKGLCSERGFEWVVKDKEDRVRFWRDSAGSGKYRFEAVIL